MGLLSKLGIGIGGGASRSVSHHATGLATGGRVNGTNGSVGAVSAPRPPEMQESTRISNGLKEFLWNLDGLGRGTMIRVDSCISGGRGALTAPTEPFVPDRKST